MPRVKGNSVDNPISIVLENKETHKKKYINCFNWMHESGLVSFAYKKQSSIIRESISDENWIVVKTKSPEGLVTPAILVTEPSLFDAAPVVADDTQYDEISEVPSRMVLCGDLNKELHTRTFKEYNTHVQHDMMPPELLNTAQNDKMVAAEFAKQEAERMMQQAAARNSGIFGRISTPGHKGVNVNAGFIPD